MRIIGGRWGGRRLPSLRAKGVRPTGDRVREAVMSALESRGLIVGARVLDLYAGTGAMGLEALSREAAHATFVDQNPTLLKHIASFAEALGAKPPMSHTIAADLSRRPERAAALLSGRSEVEGPFSLIFVDPPYADIGCVANLLSALREIGVFGVGATIVVEHAHKTPPPPLEGLATVNHYRYGDTGVALLEAVPPETS